MGMGGVLITKTTPLTNFPSFFVSYSPPPEHFPEITPYINHLQTDRYPELALEKIQEKTGPSGLSQSDGYKVIFCGFSFHCPD